MRQVPPSSAEERYQERVQALIRSSSVEHDVLARDLRFQVRGDIQHVEEHWFPGVQDAADLEDD